MIIVYDMLPNYIQELSSKDDWEFYDLELVYLGGNDDVPYLSHPDLSSVENMLIKLALEVVDGKFVNEYADWWILLANDIINTAMVHKIVHLDTLYSLPHKAVKAINKIICSYLYDIDYI